MKNQHHEGLRCDRRRQGVRPLGALLLAWFATPASVAETNPANVAFQRTYEMSPAPNYAGCKDVGDAVQLTDGERLQCDWLRHSTVGWSKQSQPITVLIDLGSVTPIASVQLFTTGGGRANVFYPGYVGVLVSDDNDQFHLVGAADSLGIPQSRTDSVSARPLPRPMTIDNLRTRGRWVLLLLEPDGDFLFLDEVEVLRGTHDPGSVVFGGDNRYGRADVAGLLPSLRERAITRQILDRFGADELAGQAPAATAVLDELRASFQTSALHRMDAWKQLQQTIDLAKARRWRTRSGKRLLWQTANPMASLSIADTPSPDAFDGAASGVGADAGTATKPPRGLDILAWQNEYESAAVTLFNADDQPIRVRPTLTPIRGAEGTTISAGDLITLRTAVFVDARGAVGRIADALIRVPTAGFDIAPGEPRQLWLTVRAPTLAPGEYAFAIDLQATDAASNVILTDLIPARLTIAPLRFPDRPTLKTFTYHYLERSDITKTAQAEAIADLRAHYVNVDVLFWSSALPMPTIDRAGKVQIDFTKHDAALDRYTGGELLLFYWGLGSKRNEVPGLRTAHGPPYLEAVKQWVTRWVAHLKERGLDYDDFAMYPFDESLEPKFEELAKFLKTEVDPKLRIFANSRGLKDGAQLQKMIPYLDIWCPRDLVFGARLGPIEQSARERIAEVWSYDCDRPAKGKPPFAYFRSQMWRAFARGDRGCGLWTYADPETGADAWHDFQWLTGRYGVVYGPQGKPEDVDFSGESIVPSRRWEAWREGVEDYEYLVQLRNAIETAKRQGRFDAADRAAVVLDGVVREVLQNQTTPDVVYRARQELTRAILQLRDP